MSKRLLKEYSRVLEEAEDSLKMYRDITMDDSNILNWTCLLLPNSAPYNKGAFRVTIKFPENYPFKPPKVDFATKIYHPNVSAETGNVCVGVLKETDWRPTTQMVDVLATLSNIVNEPNAADPINNEAAELYLGDQAKFMKVADEWVKKHAEKRPK